MASSKTFLLLGLVFAVLLIFSEVSARELTETAPTQTLTWELPDGLVTLHASVVTATALTRLNFQFLISNLIVFLFKRRALKSLPMVTIITDTSINMDTGTDMEGMSMAMDIGNMAMATSTSMEIMDMEAMDTEAMDMEAMDMESMATDIGSTSMGTAITETSNWRCRGRSTELDI
ncbi:hypothetical protein C1H46_028026 [Malus baccata]|uniref:Uncharacterized protein n=1 Tax=Malus baccata TaxID=106549 RepID=A0A540LIY2_MALBA|nr:hypothetical protein C1H46_028026 [Malus baccata]